MAAIHGQSSFSAGSAPTSFLSNLNRFPHLFSISVVVGLPGRPETGVGLRVVAAIVVGLFVVAAIGTEVSPEQHTPMNWSPIGQALAAKVVKESKNLLECSQCCRNRH